MHVERAEKHKTEFTEPFQDFITRYAWGEIWTREGLPRHTRSLLTIAMMVALNRSEELALHLRAAKNNGVTREQIKDRGLDIETWKMDGYPPNSSKR